MNERERVEGASEVVIPIVKRERKGEEKSGKERCTNLYPIPSILSNLISIQKERKTKRSEQQFTEKRKTNDTEEIV